MKTLEEKVKIIDDMVAIQSTPGNYDVDQYMRGLANGLILAQSVLHDNEPEFLQSTERKSMFQEKLDNYLGNLTKK